MSTSGRDNGLLTYRLRVDMVRMVKHRYALRQAKAGRWWADLLTMFGASEVSVDARTGYVDALGFSHGRPIPAGTRLVLWAAQRNLTWVAPDTATEEGQTLAATLRKCKLPDRQGLAVRKLCGVDDPDVKLSVTGVGPAIFVHVPEGTPDHILDAIESVAYPCKIP